MNHRQLSENLLQSSDFLSARGRTRLPGKIRTRGFLLVARLGLPTSRLIHPVFIYVVLRLFAQPGECHSLQLCDLLFQRVDLAVG